MVFSEVSTADSRTVPSLPLEHLRRYRDVCAYVVDRNTDTSTATAAGLDGAYLVLTTIRVSTAGGAAARCSALDTHAAS
jgi:hypothetical protein